METNPYLFGDEPTQEVEDEVSYAGIHTTTRLIFVCNVKVSFLKIFGTCVASLGFLRVNDSSPNGAILLRCLYTHRPRRPSYRYWKSVVMWPASGCWRVLNLNVMSSRR